MKRKILVVEDDPHIRLGLTDAFAGEGFEVFECGDGAQAMPLVRQHRPDLIVLDLMLPHKSGYDLCREIRAEKNRVPILFLSAKGQEIDRVVAFELGADDYIVKPFSLRELMLRVLSILRRVNEPESGAEASAFETAFNATKVIRFGDVEVDPRTFRGRRTRHQFDLTLRELKVLALLYINKGTVVSRETILNEVWGIEYYGTTRTLDQLIVKLRQKVEAVPGEPRHLLTVHGFGYRLEG